MGYTSLSGIVFIDSNGNGILDSGEYVVAGALVTLTGPSGTLTMTTSSNGAYSFPNLLAGSYNVSVPVYSDLLNGSAWLGQFSDPSPTISSSDYGTVINDTLVNGIKSDLIEGINLQSDYFGVNYNFTDLGLQNTLVSKRLFLASSLGTTTYWVGSIPPGSRTGHFRLAGRGRGLRRTGVAMPRRPTKTARSQSE